MNHLHRQPVRVRHEPRRRQLQVVRVEQISPRMRRIVLAGDDLAGFESAAADDHVKLILASGAMRDYTPRHFDPVACELTLEFVIHAHGPASDWAAQAAPGQAIEIGGPRGSTLIPEDYAAYVLVGDATALPAIARRLEELRPGQRAHVLVEVADAAEERPLASKGDVRIDWGALDDAALDAILPAERDVHVWIACEIETARRLRARLVEVHGFDRSQIKAAGYWRLGGADGGEKIED